MENRREAGVRNEMEPLGGFHGVRTRRGASTKVCLSQHGAGDDSYPSRNDGFQGSLFTFPLLTLSHTEQISHRHPNEIKKHPSSHLHTGEKPTTC